MSDREGEPAGGEPAAAWRPTATRAALQRRARLLAGAREFFAARGVLEVETPILSAAGVSDPQIESLVTHLGGTPGSGISGGATSGGSISGGGTSGGSISGSATPGGSISGGGTSGGGMPGRFFLSTSPEFPMKRLLAAGSGDIYQVCKVFRDAEHGRWHNPEFTLLEWYRVGFDDAALMSEVEQLVRELLAPERRLATAERVTYAADMQRHAGVDPYASTDAELDYAAARFGIACEAALERDAKLDLLMGFIVGPRLGCDRPCFVCDYPASQASLARLKPGPPPVAARFELYLDGIELANGFHELSDAGEQRSRFAQDLATRRARRQPLPPMDERLLAALESGMPDCAGVALGFDRLVAIVLGAKRLSQTMAFTIDNA
jgi:lysyl-tRNA synthetase class 2